MKELQNECQNAKNIKNEHQSRIQQTWMHKEQGQTLFSKFKKFLGQEPFVRSNFSVLFLAKDIRLSMQN